MTRTYTKEVFVIHGDRVLARFQRRLNEKGDAGINPETQAQEFLQNIGSDPGHELYDALMNGEIESVGGEPVQRGPRPQPPRF